MPTFLTIDSTKVDCFWKDKTTRSLGVRSIGRTHGAPYRGYGYVPLRFGGNVVRRIRTQQQVYGPCESKHRTGMDRINEDGYDGAKRTFDCIWCVGFVTVYHRLLSFRSDQFSDIEHLFGQPVMFHLGLLFNQWLRSIRHNCPTVILSDI